MQNPCAKQTCFVCSSPTDGNLILNLTPALNMTTSKATPATKPVPPIDHWISDITREVQYAILRYDLPELKLLNVLMPKKC